MILRITVTLLMRTEFEGVPHEATFSWSPAVGDPLAAAISAKNDEILNAQVVAAGTLDVGIG
jgi:hypothetical protein